jgi:hypothetical protein
LDKATKQKHSKEEINQMKIQYIKLNDFVISIKDGDIAYKKGSYSISSLLITSLLITNELKYCLKHSIAHRQILNHQDFNNPLKPEYCFYRNVKLLVEKLINNISIWDCDYYFSLKSIVKYGNALCKAKDYDEMPTLPKVTWIKPVEEYGALIDDIFYYKHCVFTEKYKISKEHADNIWKIYQLN